MPQAPSSCSAPTPRLTHALAYRLSHAWLAHPLGVGVGLLGLGGIGIAIQSWGAWQLHELNHHPAWQALVFVAWLFCLAWVIFSIEPQLVDRAAYQKRDELANLAYWTTTLPPVPPQLPYLQAIVLEHALIPYRPQLIAPSSNA